MTTNEATGAQQQPEQCQHRYLTREAKCVHCGMQFVQTWTAERAWLLNPTLRNLALTLAWGVVFLLFGGLGGRESPAGALLLVAMVLFATRTVLGGIETMTPHGFMVGTLGPLRRRPMLNILLPKGWISTVGRVRFPIDRLAYEHFREGDTVLVEHLRWSRLPVAIYKGTGGGTKQTDGIPGTSS